MLISSIDQNIKCFTSLKLYVLDIRLCSQLHISFKKKIAKISRMRLMIKLIFKGIISFAFVQYSFEIGLYYGTGKNKFLFSNTKYQAEPSGNSFPSVRFKGRQLQYFILSLTSYVKRGLKMHLQHYLSSLNKIMNDRKY